MRRASVWRHSRRPRARRRCAWADRESRYRASPPGTRRSQNGLQSASPWFQLPEPRHGEEVSSTVSLTARQHLRSPANCATLSLDLGTFRNAAPQTAFLGAPGGGLLPVDRLPGLGAARLPARGPDPQHSLARLAMGVDRRCHRSLRLPVPRLALEYAAQPHRASAAVAAPGGGLLPVDRLPGLGAARLPARGPDPQHSLARLAMGVDRAN